jgi:hypothetical protein
VALQPLIKIVSRETDVVLHPAAVGTLEMQQVHGTLSRHRDMITRYPGRDQVRKSTVKSELTLLFLYSQIVSVNPAHFPRVISLPTGLSNVIIANGSE